MAFDFSGFRKAAAAAAILGAAFAFTGCGDQTPEGVAVEFSKAGYEGDLDKFYDCLDTVQMKGVSKSEVTGKLQPMLEEEKRKVADQGGIKEIKSIRSVSTESGSHMLVTVRASFGNGKTEEHKVYLNKTCKGDWKVELR